MPDTPDAGGGKPITSIKRLRQRADYAARHSPYDYQSHDEQGYPGYDAELDMRAADDLAEAVGLVSNIVPPERGRYGGPLVALRAVYEDGSDESIWHEDVAKARTFLARFSKDTP